MAKVRFIDAASKIIAASANNMDATVSAVDFVEGYNGGNNFRSEKGDLVLSKGGFRQFGNHIGFPSEALMKLGSDPGLQKSVLRHVVSNENDRMLNLRVSGNNITHVLSGEHVFIKNVEVLSEVRGMIESGVLPPDDDIVVGPHYVSPDGRRFSMRIMAPAVWNYDIGNGRQDIVHGAMFVRNDEKGEGAFVCGAAIARVSCFNWTIGKFQMRIEHRFSSVGDFNDALGNTAKLIGDYSGEIASEVQATKSHKLARPELVFEKVAQRLGIPAWAMDSGRTYFDQETEASTMFDVVQAITRSSQDISDPGGRKRPKWDLRETVESGILKVAQEVISGGEDAFVVTVGDVIDELSQYDKDSEAIGFSPSPRETRGREIVINQ